MLKKQAAFVYLFFDVKPWWAFAPPVAGPVSAVKPGAHFRGVDEDEEPMGYTSRKHRSVSSG